MRESRGRSPLRKAAWSVSACALSAAMALQPGQSLLGIGSEGALGIERQAQAEESYTELKSWGQLAASGTYVALGSLGSPGDLEKGVKLGRNVKLYDAYEKLERKTLPSGREVAWGTMYAFSQSRLPQDSRPVFVVDQPASQVDLYNFYVSGSGRSDTGPLFKTRDDSTVNMVRLYDDPLASKFVDLTGISHLDVWNFAPEVGKRLRLFDGGQLNLRGQFLIPYSDGSTPSSPGPYVRANRVELRGRTWVSPEYSADISQNVFELTGAGDGESFGCGSDHVGGPVNFCISGTFDGLKGSIVKGTRSGDRLSKVNLNGGRFEAAPSAGKKPAVTVLDTVHATSPVSSYFVVAANTETDGAPLLKNSKVDLTSATGVFYNGSGNVLDDATTMDLKSIYVEVYESQLDVRSVTAGYPKNLPVESFFTNTAANQNRAVRSWHIDSRGAKLSLAGLTGSGAKYFEEYKGDDRAGKPFAQGKVYAIVFTAEKVKEPYRWTAAVSYAESEAARLKGMLERSAVDDRLRQSMVAGIDATTRSSKDSIEFTETFEELSKADAAAKRALADWSDKVVLRIEQAEAKLSVKAEAAETKAAIDGLGLPADEAKSFGREVDDEQAKFTAKLADAPLTGTNSIVEVKRKAGEAFRAIKNRANDRLAQLVAHKRAEALESVKKTVDAAAKQVDAMKLRYAESVLSSLEAARAVAEGSINKSTTLEGIANGTSSLDATVKDIVEKAKSLAKDGTFKNAIERIEKAYGHAKQTIAKSELDPAVKSGFEAEAERIRAQGLSAAFGAKDDPAVEKAADETVAKFEDLERRVKKAVEQKKALEKAKEDAKDKIDDAADDAKKGIDKDPSVTDKDSAKKDVDDAADKAKDKVDQAKTPEEAEQAGDQGVKDVEKIGETSKAKEDAKKKVDEAADKAKDGTDADPSVTDKESAHKDIDRAADKAKKDIDGATNPDDARNKGEEGVRAVDEAAEAAKAKPAAKAEVDKAADAAKKKVDRARISDKAKSLAKEDIDRAAKKAYDKIDEALTRGEVKEAVSEAKDAFEQAVEDAYQYDSDIADGLGTYLQRIRDAASEARKELGAMAFGPDSEPVSAVDTVERRALEFLRTLDRHSREEATRSTIEEFRRIVEMARAHLVPPADALYGNHFAYIKGYADNTFRPYATATRAEVAKMLVGALALPTDVPARSFPDIKASDWYAKSVAAVVEAGYMKGDASGTFRPNAPISRAEIVQILYNLSGATPQPGAANPFRDLDRSFWGYDAIVTMHAKGMAKGYEVNGVMTFRPNARVTRAETVTFLNRHLGRATDAHGIADVARELSRKNFRDVNDPKGQWFYYAVMEAAHSHAFEREGAGQPETWDELL